MEFPRDKMAGMAGMQIVNTAKVPLRWNWNSVMDQLFGNSRSRQCEQLMIP
jgi:hypothetical protein